MKTLYFYLISMLILSSCATQSFQTRGTGNIGVIILRATGSVLIVDNLTNEVTGEVKGLGDLSHASIVFHRNGLYAYVFGRDGGLTKLNLLTHKIEKRVIQGGNSIGGAISQDSRYVAVSNYEPGGIKIFDSEDLKLIADIPAKMDNGNFSKTVGLVDAPGNHFVYSLFEGGEIWSVKINKDQTTTVTKYKNAGKEPYDGLVSPEGRYYLAGLFGENGISIVDLWHPEKNAVKVMQNYGRGEQKLPVYKMPHFEGWSMCGQNAFIPGVGHHEVIVAQLPNWKEVKRIKTHGQPVFAMSSPTCRYIWVNFALPDNDTLQIIDTETYEIVKTMKLGPAILHMEFTPKGDQVWVSVRDMNQIQVFDTQTYELLKTIPAQSPSGIFFTNRAHRIGL